MKLVIVCSVAAILVIGCSFAECFSSQFFTSQELDFSFHKFKTDFDRSYRTTEDERYRKQVFADNLEFIVKSNLEAHFGRRTYLVAINNFTDLTNGEFRRVYNGFRRGAPKMSSLFDGHRVHIGKDLKDLPSTVDWTQEGAVTGVKNQGQCGSCWAFSAVASIEGQHALKDGPLVSLSEQNLIDCSSSYGNQGCNGGLMDQAFQYVIQNGGIDTEDAYSYSGIQQDCQFDSRSIGAQISGYVDVASGDEAALQNAVATVGPISVAIDASQSSFQFYSSGVYNEPNCSPVSLDHGVAAVGYGTLNGVDYWKVKNSWGTGWGDQGYVLMSRNNGNQCGIATSASYPTV